MSGLDYTGKRAVVTGCASGIGAATARLLVDLGAEVHGLDRNGTSVPVARFDTVDLGDPGSIDAVVDRLGGGIDALFNCAGLAPTYPKIDVLKVNLLGTRHLTQRILERMGEGGAIVTTSSNGGRGYRAHLVELIDLLDTVTFADGLAWIEKHQAAIANAYSYSKEALTVWTLRESAKTIERGVRMNCTSPGAVQTPMLDQIEARVATAVIDAVAQPIGRRATPEEQAWPLVFLNCSAASYINGADLPVDGGFAAGLTVRSPL
jgi:NAD(P)-dependent dehydrogenase (short-subunit alcohol dehydrogenase family)